jgi:hypothetical protein
MKRCEAEWLPARAAGVQAVVREMCGGCPCEMGIPCPLFARRGSTAGAAACEHGEVVPIPA